ncbi:hypothetical protein Q763_01385 [Flavobacterium beibuense F44-8]|uniref:Tyr recombinase domain-containing protein n=1 Tax=Flavobacterium beibuense F44-8 TaxID=1406840 RepID=A0A0A2LWN9_9FLAO|nr:site-specific integrase [Flavobacterium beibuense]KGO84424.1 hypothetical protein Q763_01385 [Flavobacterium beibuense F44-8]
MPSINRILRNEYDFEYVFEYDLKKQKQYGGPTIYDGGGDLNRRWYVYYSFRNPETGKLERQPPIYADLDNYNTVKERLLRARALCKSVKLILEEGFNPYTPEPDNSILSGQSDKEPVNINSAKKVAEAIDFALAYAKNLHSESSYNDFKSRITRFRDWLVDSKPATAKMNEIESIDAIGFLNDILQRTSPRNRNNTRAALSSLYKILKNNQIVKENIIEGIDILKSSPKKNKTYTKQQEEDILKLMAEKDKHLLLFVKFISINMLRPVEVCRLQKKDIHIIDKILKVRAKNQPVKTKIIPDILLQDIPDLTPFKNTDFIFTPNGVGEWDAKEVNRRNHFGKRFKIIKDELGLGEEYGLYSFRHTYITRIYRELRKELTPFESKSRLMLITGHSTMDALEKYLRDIDAELPDDYSYLIKG